MDEKKGKRRENKNRKTETGINYKSIAFKSRSISGFFYCIHRGAPKHAVRAESPFL
jgi:hypothetical protein